MMRNRHMQCQGMCQGKHGAAAAKVITAANLHTYCTQGNHPGYVTSPRESRSSKNASGEGEQGLIDVG